MRHVAQGLVLHRDAELGRALGRRVQVDVDLAVELAAPERVLVEDERHDVGVVVVAQPLAVEPAHEGVVAQHDADARRLDALHLTHGPDDGDHQRRVQLAVGVGGVDLDAGPGHAPVSGVPPSKNGSLSESTTAAWATSGATVKKSAESRRSATFA